MGPCESSRAIIDQRVLMNSTVVGCCSKFGVRPIGLVRPAMLGDGMLALPLRPISSGTCYSQIALPWVGYPLGVLRSDIYWFKTAQHYELAAEATELRIWTRQRRSIFIAPHRS